MLQTNIYDQDIIFTLQFRDDETLILEPLSQINEPMNWNKMINSIPRSKQWFGFWTDFIEDKFGLTFSFNKDGGGAYLKNIYDNFGDQAEVYFTIRSAAKTIKSWRVNLQEYELAPGSDILPFGGVMTSIEKMPFQGKLQARMSADVTINQQLTMDGEFLTPINPVTLRLHSKTLEENTISQTPSTQTLPESQGTFFDTYLILQPDQSANQINELYQVFNQPAGILDTTSRLPAIAATFIPVVPVAGTPAAPPPFIGCGLYTGHDAGGYADSPLTFAQPFLDALCQYTPTTSGILNITWSGLAAAFYFYKGTGAYAGTTDFWSITPRCVVIRNILGVDTVVSELYGTTKTISTGLGSLPAPTSPMTGGLTSIATAGLAYILPSVTGSTPRGSVAKVSGYTFSESFNNIPIQAGDNVYVHLLLCPNKTVTSHEDGWITVDGFENTIQYNQLTVTPGSTASAYRILDVLNQQVECITGQKNAVQSSFFGEGGAGWKRLLLNGYLLRNFNAQFNAPKKSLQNTLNSLSAIHCLGVGVQEIDGVENLRVEYITDLLKTLEIARFTDTLNCRDKHNAEVCFNQFKFGFNIWQGLNLLMQDEFNTQGSYLTQFLKYGNKEFSKMCDFILSGYIIEEQRRNQFLLNPNQSITNDEDWFSICTAEPCVFATELKGSNGLPYLVSEFSASSSQFGINLTSLALITGDQIQTLTGANSGTIFTVVSQAPGFPIIGQDAYIVSPAPLDEIVTSGVIITPASPDQVFAERNQPFKICSGVIDPSTIYNGRDSLKHILYNWKPVIAVGLYFAKSDNLTQIIPTIVKMNSNFTTQFLSSEPFKGNAGNLLLVEIAREDISNFQNGELYSPIQMLCDIRGGWNQIEQIRLALSGETGDDTIDFGGLTLKDSAGDLWFCHVNSLKYDLVKEMINLDVQKVFKLGS